jgi:hypothetical protein
MKQKLEVINRKGFGVEHEFDVAPTDLSGLDSYPHFETLQQVDEFLNGKDDLHNFEDNEELDSLSQQPLILSKYRREKHIEVVPKDVKFLEIDGERAEYTFAYCWLEKKVTKHIISGKNDEWVVCLDCPHRTKKENARIYDELPEEEKGKNTIEEANRISKKNRQKESMKEFWDRLKGLDKNVVGSDYLGFEEVTRMEKEASLQPIRLEASKTEINEKATD